MVGAKWLRATNGLSRSGAVVVLAVVWLAAAAAGARAVQPERPPSAYLGIVVGAPGRGGQGVLVREVTADSPAAKAGLRGGDHVVKVEDRDVQSVEQFLQSISSHKPGDRMTFHVMRGGQEQTVTATLGERPATGGVAQTGLPGLIGGRRPAFLGVQMQPLTPEVKQRLRVSTEAGVVVTEVVPNSPAAKAGLKPDDVITALNDKAVRDPAQLREVIQEIGPDLDVTIKIARGDQQLSLNAKLGEAGLGMFLTPGGERFPTLDVESLTDQARRMRDLERRVEDLEKRVRELEKKQPPPAG